MHLTKKIYYLGSKEEWNRINLQNSCIPSDAEIIYNAAGCDANIHSLGEWIAEVPETCTKDGVMEHYECSVCHKYFDKDTKSEEISATIERALALFFKREGK